MDRRPRQAAPDRRRADGPGAENEAQEERARGIERPDATVKLPGGDADDEGTDGDQADAKGRCWYVVLQQPVAVNLVHAASLRASTLAAGHERFATRFQRGMKSSSICVSLSMGAC